jgi:hypothetical protein
MIKQERKPMLLELLTTFQLQLAVCFMFVWTVIFDALRDGWMKSEGWWKRHIAKWAQFYPVLIFILLLVFPWWVPIVLAVPSWCLWQISLRWIAGVKWESWLFRLIDPEEEV